MESGREKEGVRVGSMWFPVLPAGGGGEEGGDT